MLNYLPKNIHNSYFRIRNSQSGQACLPAPKGAANGGQALIILLLVMVVALTVGLSVASRSLTNVRVSTQSELSQKAFSAAEAGIEDALRQDLAVFTGATNVAVGDVKYDVEVVHGTASSSFTPDRPVEKDDVVQLNLTGTSATSLNIYWVDQANPGQQSPKSSLEISEVYQSGGNYLISKSTVNPTCSSLSDDLPPGGIPENNGFTSASCVNTGGLHPTGSSTNYFARVQVALHSNSTVLRIRPFYNRTSVAVEAAAPAGAQIPEQTVKITSTGVAGTITRKVQVTKSVNALPPIFDYVLYSGSNLSK